MFTDFFYTLKKVGIPVSPTSFLQLQKALGLGLVNSIDDFYTAARTILIKSERYFDLYDQVFAHRFEGAELKDPEEFELAEVARALLDEWLKSPEDLARAMGADEKELSKMTGLKFVEAPNHFEAQAAFDGAVKRLGIEEPWARLRDTEYAKIAVAWLEKNGISYERDIPMPDEPDQPLRQAS